MKFSDIRGSGLFLSLHQMLEEKTKGKKEAPATSAVKKQEAKMMVDPI